MEQAHLINGSVYRNKIVIALLLIVCLSIPKLSNEQGMKKKFKNYLYLIIFVNIIIYVNGIDFLKYRCTVLL